MRREFHWFPAAVTGAMLVYSLLPIVTFTLFSFNPSPFYAFPLTGFTTDWYVKLLADGRIGDSLVASVTIAASVMVAATVIGTMFAFFVVRAAVPFKRVLAGLGFLPLVVPVLVLAAGLQVTFVEIGLPLGFGTVILGHVIYATPFVTLMVMAPLYRYNPALDAAARDLGAGPFTTLRLVTLPILWPGIRSGALLAFLLSFNEWAIAFFTGRGVNSLPMLVYSLQRNGLPPTVLAYAALSTAVVAIAALAVLPLVTRLLRGSK
ncbi:ABC transporter permease [Zavarzinia aquatilis]|uniref:Spermidine/putrescine ABC transporter permease n=1 Tax=Zavarzinia aquatilis TaxID=2211142 RepID=A0A317EIF7_9PROT|nr:ABC transporter permease [Zavarzinia aquatilis]PWR25213.1 spermidine/putrescine ABC transporter permease [Zavarzinia aquatilis]